MEIVVKFKNWILEFSLICRVTLVILLWGASHPITLCILLILLASTIGMISGLVFTKWVSYVIALLFLGGMMIIFLYVTSLANNEKLLLNLNYTGVYLGTLVVTVFSFFLITFNRVENLITHIFYSLFTPLLWFLIFFLLITLFVVVKITESFKGALIKFI